MSKTTGDTARTKEEICSWEKTHGIEIEETSLKALNALAALHAKGCNPVRLLELLRIYSSQRSQPYVNAEKRAKARLRMLDKLVKELREAATTASALLDCDPPIAEELVTMADNVEGLRWIYEDNSFTREFGGTLVFLALAFRLIKAKTHKPHYKQILDILEVFTPDEADGSTVKSEDAIRHQVNRFQERNPGAIGRHFDREPEKVIQLWLNAWYSIEPECGAGEQRPKPVQVQLTPTGVSTQAINAHSPKLNIKSQSPKSKAQSPKRESHIEK